MPFTLTDLENVVRALQSTDVPASRRSAFEKNYFQLLNLLSQSTSSKQLSIATLLKSCKRQFDELKHYLTSIDKSVLDAIAADFDNGGREHKRIAETGKINLREKLETLHQDIMREAKEDFDNRIVEAIYYAEKAGIAGDIVRCNTDYLAIISRLKESHYPDKEREIKEIYELLANHWLKASIKKKEDDEKFLSLKMYLQHLSLVKEFKEPYQPITRQGGGTVAILNDDIQSILKADLSQADEVLNLFLFYKNIFEPETLSSMQERTSDFICELCVQRSKKYLATKDYAACNQELALALPYASQAWKKHIFDYMTTNSVYAEMVMGDTLLEHQDYFSSLYSYFIALNTLFSNNHLLSDESQNVLLDTIHTALNHFFKQLSEAHVEDTLHFLFIHIFALNHLHRQNSLMEHPAIAMMLTTCNLALEDAFEKILGVVSQDNQYVNGILLDSQLLTELYQQNEAVHPNVFLILYEKIYQDFLILLPLLNEYYIKTARWDLMLATYRVLNFIMEDMQNEEIESEAVREKFTEFLNAYKADHLLENTDELLTQASTDFFNQPHFNLLFNAMNIIHQWHHHEHHQAYNPMTELEPFRHSEIATRTALETKLESPLQALHFLRQNSETAPEDVDMQINSDLSPKTKK